jgi:hypothetical protein
MTGLLQVRIQAHLPDLPAGTAGQAGSLAPQLIEAATLQAYSECFRAMVLAAVAATPLVALFRIRSTAIAVEQDMEQKPSPLLRPE